MARTWFVRLAARRLTLPVRSFHVPAAPGRLPGRRGAFDADLARHGGDLLGEIASVSVIC